MATYTRRYTSGESLRPGEVRPAVADLIVGGVNRDYDGAVSVGGAARSGVVGQEILGAGVAVDTIEDGAQFLGRVGIEHGAASGVRHGFEGVLASGVAAAFVFYWAGDGGVKKRLGGDGFLGGGFLLEADLFVGAQAGIDHDRQVQRLGSFRLELVDLLLHAFFKQLEGLPGKVRRGAIFVVEDADKNIHKIDVDADAATLGSDKVLRIVGGGGRRGPDDFSGFAVWSGSGSCSRGGRRTRLGS